MRCKKISLNHPTEEGQGGEWCTAMMFLSLKQVVFCQEHHEGWCCWRGFLRDFSLDA